VRIVTGTLRGRQIPFNPRRFGNARVTSGKLKEALFSALGGMLEGESFLDLCAGSGQIALEAYSRGARITAVEPDQRRLLLLRKLVAEWDIEDAELLGVKAQTLIPQFQRQSRRFDTIYLDPPYDAQVSSRPLAIALIELIGNSDLLNDGGLLAVQHFKGLQLPQEQGCLRAVRQRPYGDTVLTQYSTLTQHTES